MGFPVNKYISAKDFTSDGVEYYPLGVAGTATAGIATNIDVMVPVDAYFTGVLLSVGNAAFGDYAQLQIVHPVAGVVRVFGDKYYMTDEDSQLVPQLDIDLSYCGALNAGLTLRMVYTSVGTVNPKIVVDYRLHKAL